MDLIGNDISLDGVIVTPDDELELESILAEYGGEPPERDDLPPFAEPPSRPIDIRPDRQGTATAQLRSDEDEDIRIRTAPPPPQDDFGDDGDDDIKIYGAAKEPPAEEAPDEDDDIKIYSADDAKEKVSHIPVVHISDSGDFREYRDDWEEAPPSPPPFREDKDDGEPDGQAERPRAARAKSSASAPVLSFLAVLGMRLQKIKQAGPAVSSSEEDLGPELDAGSASKYYAGHISSLRLRMRLAIVLTAVLAWISFGLPVAGALKLESVAALVCLIVEIGVVMLGLDVFTSGIMSLLRGKPSLWTFVSLSCIAAAVDAAVTVAKGSKIIGLPFCGVAAMSVCFALAGALQTCKANRLSLHALSLSRDPYSVTCESGIAEDGTTLLKTKSGVSGFLRRCEEPDCAEEVYGLISPFLLILLPVLALIATAISGEWTYFFRAFAAICAPCAPFAAFLAFPMPYSMITRRAFQSGAAIAGWSGLRDIGQAKHLIVTDGDIFPPGTLSIESVRILEGIWPEKVISCVSSVICASGSGLAPVFAELMRKNHCSMLRVEDFCCHEGGGLTALINGEEVLCGGASFMHLMGVRLPQKLASKSSVFVSINGVLAGIFTIKYTPVTSVQTALVNLLHARREPVFAIRDFNITPLMIRQKFRMPTDGFDFPTFAKRYEISSASPDAESRVSAIINREGLGPLVEVSESGRKLYITTVLTTVLSLLCTLVGVVLMFSLCLSGSFDSATAGNMLTYMLLWLAPIIILAFGLNR